MPYKNSIKTIKISLGDVGFRARKKEDSEERDRLTVFLGIYNFYGQAYEMFVLVDTVQRSEVNFNPFELMKKRENKEGKRRKEDQPILFWLDFSRQD